MTATWLGKEPNFPYEGTAAQYYIEETAQARVASEIGITQRDLPGPMFETREMRDKRMGAARPAKPEKIPAKKVRSHIVAEDQEPLGMCDI